MKYEIVLSDGKTKYDMYFKNASSGFYVDVGNKRRKGSFKSCFRDPGER